MIGWFIMKKKENVDYFKPNKFRDEIDNGLGYYCHNGGVNDFFENHELLTAHNGKKYIVLNLKNSNTNKFLEQLSKMQEVRDKFLATMPNLDEMSDYEKVLGILSFMSYIKYGFDEKAIQLMMHILHLQVERQLVAAFQRHLISWQKQSIYSLRK